MPLWRCTWLYQCANSAAHCLACASDCIPWTGNSGRYLTVLNSDSTKALSSARGGGFVHAHAAPGQSLTRWQYSGTPAASSQHGHDTSWWHVCKSRLIGHTQDLLAFGLRQCVPHLGVYRHQYSCQQRCCANAAKCAHQFLRLHMQLATWHPHGVPDQCPGPVSGGDPRESFFPVLSHHRLEFFDSTSSAAVSAKAFSLRRNSRSSACMRLRSCLRVLALLSDA